MHPRAMDSRVHVITGEQAQVVAAVEHARAEGRLVGITEIRWLGGDRVRLVARLRVPPRAQAARDWCWLRRVGKALVVLLVIAAVAGLVWALVWGVLAVIGLVTAVIGWIHAHLLAIGLVAAVVVGLAVFGAGGGCGGMHCGGCRG
jgi:hypothetical protein